MDGWTDSASHQVTLTKAFLKNVQAQILNATSMERGRLKQNMSMGRRKVWNCEVRCSVKVYIPKVWHFLFIFWSWRQFVSQAEGVREGEQWSREAQTEYIGWISFADVWCFPLTSHSRESPLILDVLTPPFGRSIQFLLSVKFILMFFSSFRKGVSQCTVQHFLLKDI